MRRIPVWLRIALPILGLAVLALTASLTLSKLEEKDTFCISCHTIPEVAYHQRALQASGVDDPALDLGSRHYQLDPGGFGCIACHRGAGTLHHRLVTNALAARDTLIWLAGAADPALEKGTSSVPMLLNAACAQCHQETLGVVGFENHFHAYLPEAYALIEGRVDPADPPLGDGSTLQMPGPEGLTTTVSCVNCHKAHVQVPGAELQGYLDLLKDVYPACETCHLESGLGPVQLAGSGS